MNEKLIYTSNDDKTKLPLLSCLQLKHTKTLNPNNLQTICQASRFIIDPELQPVVQNGLVHVDQLIAHSGPTQVLRRQDEKVAHGVQGVEEGRHGAYLPVTDTPTIFLIFDVLLLGCCNRFSCTLIVIIAAGF